MAKMRYRWGREGGKDETSAKTESTFAQALPLFLLEGVLRFSIGAFSDRLQGPVTKPDKIKGMTLIFVNDF
jgi:hypothetical protein